MPNETAAAAQAGRSSPSGSRTSAEESAARLRHDLRQSLGTVMALVDIVADCAEPRTDALPWLRRLQDEAAWLVRLVQTTGPEDAPPCSDAGSVVSAAWVAAAARASCDMRLVREAGADTTCDAVSLTRATRNLIDNAVRAAGPDGHVDVRVLSGAKEIVLEVDDSGPGFGAAGPPHGLGLKTAEAVANENGGSLSLGVGGPGSSLVRLVLPRRRRSEEDDR